MPIDIQSPPGNNVVEVRVSGKLTGDDYEKFRPEIERLIETHGKIRLLFEMHDFHGWDVGALWEDIKFDAKHHAHITKLAMIGEKTWEKWMATICRPFTAAKIQYFGPGPGARDAAEQWLYES